MLESPQSVVVWDNLDSPPTDRFVLLWNGYKEENDQCSILKTMEKHSDEFRSEYLAFIHELGQLRVRGKRLVEHLEIETGFSLWWMSLLAEKNPSKSKAPLDCLRLLTINHLFREIKPHAVELVSGNKRLSIVLKQLCTTLDISFTWTKVDEESFSFTLKNLWLKTPHILQAPFFFIRYLYLRWPLRKGLHTNWFKGENVFSIISYFLNLDHGAFKEGNFYSRYWGVLPDKIRRSGININWIHHFMFSKQFPDTKSGISCLKQFNEGGENQGYHNFLDSFISLSVVFKVIILWLQIAIKSVVFISKLDEEMASHYKGWLWFFLREDWKKSTHGITAIQNILLIHLFDRAMSSLPTQKIGLYLCENQGWERAFIHYWKKHGHGRLIAVAHSTVRYWDLRYFDVYDVWQDEYYLSQPKPDQIALNGPAAWQIYIGANQPMDKMVEVEALRYLYLEKFKISNKKIEFKNFSINKKILILGDIQSSTTHSMLRLLESISEFLSQSYELTVKPHPANPIKKTDYPILHFNISNAPLEQLFPKYNAVIATTYTSSALEALCVGLPVITILDQNDFNFSPLRGVMNLQLISKSKDLKQALLNTDVYYRQVNDETYFWTDPELPMWKMILNLD